MTDYDGPAPSGGWSLPDAPLPSRGPAGYGAPPAPPLPAAPYGAAGSPYAAPAGPRPGVVPLHPLTVADILDGAFATIRRHPRATLGLAGCVAVVQQLLALAVSAALGTGSAAVSTTRLLAQSAGAGIVVLLVDAVLSAVLTGLLAAVVGDAVLGRAASVGGAWRRVRPRVWPLIGVATVAAVVPLVTLPVVVGVWLWGAWALAVPALVLEGCGVGAALRRSHRLVRGSWWRVFGIRALSVVLAGVVGAVVAIPFTLGSVLSVLAGGTGATDQGTFALVLIALGRVVASTLTAPFLAGVLTLLYVDRRMRREAFDITLQQAAEPGQ